MGNQTDVEQKRPVYPGVFAMNDETIASWSAADFSARGRGTAIVDATISGKRIY
jgi:hypothetical protein